MNVIPPSWSPFFRSLLRIAASLSFITHGTQKLFAWPVLQPQNHMPYLSQMGAAGAIEAVGGVLMLLGLFTRPVAFLLAGEMAVAYFLQHAPRSPFPMLSGGELAVLYCFIWLYICAAGPGPLSVDALLKRSKRDR